MIDTLARWAGIAAAPLASGRGGWRVCVAGRDVIRLGPESRPDRDRGERYFARRRSGRVARGDRPRRRGDTVGRRRHAARAAGGRASMRRSPGARTRNGLATSTSDGDVWLWQVGTGQATARSMRGASPSLARVHRGRRSARDERRRNRGLLERREYRI